MRWQAAYALWSATDEDREKVVDALLSQLRGERDASVRSMMVKALKLRFAAVPGVKEALENLPPPSSAQPRTKAVPAAQDDF